ncbi:MAG: HAD-IA family hydrolase [Bacteroidales bacterium]|nr:HAD-IA family hydrolase [Bacteroidales bacterium]
MNWRKNSALYKLVLFDLDGTLLDTLDDLSEAVNHSLRLRELPGHSRDEYRKMVGHGVRNLVKQALPADLQADDAVIDAALTDFKAYYTAHIDVHTHPYPGMPEVVRRLHEAGVLLAVASNKFQEGTDYLVEKLFPGIPFVAVLGNRPGYPLKPDPEIVGEVLRRTGVRPGDAVLVGDSPTDMKTAANGGIAAIAVSWGYRPMKDYPGLTVVDSAEELMNQLLTGAPR